MRYLTDGINYLGNNIYSSCLSYCLLDMACRMIDETRINIVVNGDLLSITLKDAVRIHERLGQLLDPENKFPEGSLFNLGKHKKEYDDEG